MVVVALVGGGSGSLGPQLVVPILRNVADPGERLVPTLLNDLQIPNLKHTRWQRRHVFEVGITLSMLAA